jgi:hypothetical protein
MVSRSAPPAPIERASDDRAELARVLGEVAEELGRMRRSEPLAGGGAQRTAAVDPPASDLELVVAAIDRLSRALEAAPQAGSAETVLARQRLLSEGTRPEALAVLGGRPWEDLLREHVAWRQEDLLRRYGRPTSIGGQTWIYTLSMPGGEEQVRFHFSDSGYLQAVSTHRAR